MTAPDPDMLKSIDALIEHHEYQLAALHSMKAFLQDQRANGEVFTDGAGHRYVGPKTPMGWKKGPDGRMVRAEVTLKRSEADPSWPTYDH